MRQFTKPYSIGRLSLEARVLYTSFLVFLLLGVASSLWLYRDSFGDLSALRAADYYLGSATQTLVQAPPSGAGPALELPVDPAAPPAEAVRLLKPPRQVIETFHFHLFTVPVVLLIVGHIFMLTSLSARTKVAVLGASSLSAMVHVLAPLAIRFAGAGFAWLMPSTVVMAAVSWLPMLLWPIWEMWRPSPAAAPEEPAGSA